MNSDFKNGTTNEILPQVCILTAGTGSRLGRYSEMTNKALLPLQQKAVISHIIEKFPKESEFIIAVGFKAELVREYLLLAHPELRFHFVEVENYRGKGSGPGHSILCCKEVLNNNFFLVTADTLWTEDVGEIPLTQSWVTVAEVPVAETPHYCNILVQGNRAVEIRDKIEVVDGNSRAFTGFAFIRDAKLFWQGLENDRKEGGEKQLAAGFREIMDAGCLQAHPITWTDVGTEERYLRELNKDEQFDFGKDNEFFYLFNGRVIKFFSDPEVVSRRVKKSAILQAVFPVVEKHTRNFYLYRYQEGETLYRENSPGVFVELLVWLEKNLWRPQNTDPHLLAEMCERFYRKKTTERLKLYVSKYGAGETHTVNGRKVPSVNELLARIDWRELCAGKAFFIHGDLQPDNIIYNRHDNRFLLLDWRQDFAGEIKCGDIYYDFAKMWAGLNLNYDLIKKNEFEYHENADSCEFHYPSHPYSVENFVHLEELIRRYGCSVHKVKVLTALIYLNMSALHAAPFDKMLHALGREMLSHLLMQG